jgi:heme exporter protein C
MSRLIRALGGLAALALLAGMVMAFAVAPREVTQGNVQRIMYVHVPAVWVAYLAFLMVFVASIVFLTTRAPRADYLAHAGAEVGVLFLGVNIATGSIWGKPTWGTWWTWDARLTSVTVVFLIYVGYLLLRRMIDEPERAARYAAILGVLGAPNIYLVHVSVQWWRTLHQPPTLLKAGSATLAPIFWWTILANFVAFALLSAYFVAKRTQLLRREQEATV